MAMVLEFSKTLGSKTTKSHQHHSYFYVSDTFPRTQEHSYYWKPPKIVHSCGVNRLSSAVVNWLSLTDHKFPKDWFSTIPNALGSQDHLAVKLYNPIWEPSTAIAGVEKTPVHFKTFFIATNKKERWKRRRQLFRVQTTTKFPVGQTLY